MKQTNVSSPFLTLVIARTFQPQYTEIIGDIRLSLVSIIIIVRGNMFINDPAVADTWAHGGWEKKR